jgi:hypothetical protein
MVVESNIKATKNQVKNRLEDILAILKRCKEQKTMPPFGMLSEANSLAGEFSDADILKLLKEITVTEQEVVKIIAQNTGFAPNEIRNFYNLLASDPLKAAEYYFSLEAVQRMHETGAKIRDEKAPLPSDAEYEQHRQNLENTKEMRAALAPALAVEAEVLRQNGNQGPAKLEKVEEYLEDLGKRIIDAAVMKKHRDQPNKKREIDDIRRIDQIFAENSIFHKDVAAVPEHKIDRFVVTFDANFLKEAIETSKIIAQEQAAARVREETQERVHKEAESIRREFEEARERERVTAKKTEQELVVEVVAQDPKEEVRQGKEVKKGDIDPDDMFEDLDDDFQKENVHFVPGAMRSISESSKYNPHIPIVQDKKTSGKTH